MSDNIVDAFRDTVEETEAAAHTDLIRLTDPVYADGESAPRASDVDAEQVAFEVFTQGDVSIENPFDLSSLWIYWGQFTDHDIDLTLEQEGEEAELLKDDGPLSVTRSEFTTDEDGVRQHENVISPFIDGSNVYGSSEEFQLQLRSLEGGRLKTQEGVDGVDLLPTGDQVFGTEGDSNFIAGDIRSSENPGLSAIHTTWVNEHNYWADKFADENPEWTDEQIFQNARSVVEALIQKITYEEFLPILVGDELPEYTGFDENVDVSVSQEFSVAAFRFGHTAIPDDFSFIEENGDNAQFDATVVNPFTRQESEIEVDGELELLQVFGNQTPLENGGVANVLRGTLEDKAQKIDSKVVDGLNLFLFTEDGGLTGFSLPERNILRGRDHGLDTYINVRAEVVGDIDPADFVGSTDFSIITSDVEVQAQLASVYGTVDQVDLWVGGIVEDYAGPNVTIGATFQAIIVDQFTRARDGDPFFYLNREFAPEIQDIIDNTQLSDVLIRSGGVEHVQRDALLASERIGGTEGNDRLEGDDGRDLLIGFEGNDRLKGGKGDDDIFGDEGNDRLFGEAGDDALNGGEGNDRLDGGRGADELSGGEGNDRLFGRQGDDALNGGEGNDLLRGGNGVDILVGGEGNDRLFGGAKADTLFGGEGSDILKGGNGNDQLIGGDGFDKLTGGKGADIFTFHATDSEFDRINDFSEADTIQLIGYDATFADLEITEFRNRSEISINGDLIAEVKGSDALDLQEDDFIFA